MALENLKQKQREEREDKRREAWELTLSYKRLFAGSGGEEDAKKVLDDLCERFGYTKTSYAEDNNGRGDPLKSMHNDGCKEPLRHIFWQMNRRAFEEEKTERTAKHE